MKRVLLFLFCSISLMVMVRMVEDSVPSIDPFDDRRPYKAQDFEGYGELQIARMKIRHAAERNQTYDIGLFGNSRILSVGHGQLAVGACTMFNFALSGQSFRSSIQLIEHLARKKALPRIAVISMDNFELQMYNNPIWIGWRERWGLLADDLAAALRQRDSSLRDESRILWRFVWTEKILFQRQFEFTFFRRALLEFVGLNGDPFPTAKNGGHGYRPDGSFYYPPPRLVDAQPLIHRTSSQIINAILRNDLERLFRLARKDNIKLLIYESPLYPTSAAIFERAPSPFAVADRRTFLETCAEFGVTCAAAPNSAFSKTTGWSDATHPPPDEMGKWISALLRPYLAECIS